ncbi:Deleted in malignant brain tumors 1 protein [Apostichopus japonicus]|uniref:Deleted in malignant brain tumors 1 protein n=1 Tax=Stichopus japonicus TaxID=307972 RepID=A0A2G8LPU5_STIJA|nr:Deleted in malignant brain tumors 1 protein [Apostichopus japonicus]
MTRLNRFYFSLVAVTLIGGANVVLGQFGERVIPLMKPSGEFMSIGYPNSEPAHTAWRITVEGGYRIQLQFLDFQLHETDSCYLDFIDLYDAPVQDDVNSLIGKWCWNNFTKLMPNTFNSTNNSFYLIFRGHGTDTRKGFKAKYFSFNSSVLNTAEHTSHEPSTSTLGIASALLTQVIIIAGGGAVILLVCIVVICIICLFCNRSSKRKNTEPVDIPPYDTNNQVTGGNTLNQSQDSNIITQRDESGGGVYNVPSNEEGSASDNYDDIRYSRHIDVCIDLPQKQNGGDLRNEKLLDNNLQMSNLKGSPYDKKQSNSTKETGSDVVDDIQAYSSVDVTNLTQPENVEARYEKDDVTYSLPVKNKRESEEMFFNVTYESYDSKS